MTQEAERIILDRYRIMTGLLGILTLVIVGTVLRQAQDVLIPLMIAWLLSFVLGPAINFLTRRRVPTPLAVALVVLLLLWGFYLVGIFLYARLKVFAAAYPEYHGQLAELTEATIGKFTERWDIGSDILKDLEWETKATAFVGNLVGVSLSFLGKLLMVIIFLIFLLIGKPYLPYKIKKAFSSDKAEKMDRIMNTMSHQIGRYLSLQFLISLATGIFVWTALHLIGVDFAVTWAALAFFLNFIPTFGSIAASIPPILLAVVQFYPSAWQAVVTFAALLTIQVVIGNFLSPKIMGDELNLSPVVVLISLVFFGWMWGIVGALISVPIASAIKIVCENIEPLHPISIMMGSGKIYRKEFRQT